MDSNITFLTEEQIFGDKQLDIFQKYGPACAITDFSILLGGFVSNDHHTKEGDTDKDRTGWWWTRTDNRDTDARAVDNLGIYYNIVRTRNGGARPAIPYSSISSIASNEVRGSFGIKDVEYGEYPQTIVDDPQNAYHVLTGYPICAMIIITGAAVSFCTRAGLRSEGSRISGHHF